MKPEAVEINIDGLIGPTYNFGGLGYGNLASMHHAMQISRPKEAALQGLYKMKLLSDLGIKQAILPPQERPDLRILEHLGFRGSEVQIMEKAYRESPDLLVACSSAASAWAANAATISPSADTRDGRVHITPANLASSFHRSFENETTALSLFALFPHPEAFVHHDPLPSHPSLGDEGAANQMRLCSKQGESGIEVFIYGKYGFQPHQPTPKNFPGRQTAEASAGVARLHLLDPNQVVFAQQNPDLIDIGVFHNDVCAMSHRNLVVYYENAWLHTQAVVDEMAKKFEETCRDELHMIAISSETLPVDEMVSSYLFNSQLITIGDDKMALIAPTEARDNPRSEAVIHHLVEGNNPISKVLYFDLRQSMHNGGGPACLRLRATLTESELAAAHQPLFLDETLYPELVEWVNTYYRDELKPGDLADPELLFETRRALDDLTELLDLGPLYPFQQV